MYDLGVGDWAREQLASARFGDERRCYRAERMLRRAAARPAGRLTEVFTEPPELQAAYDFVQGRVPPQAIVEAFAEATLRAAESSEFVFAVVDGSTLTLTDRVGGKGFGTIGMRSLPAHGLKVIDAIAVDGSGAPMGLLGMEFWSREPEDTRSRFCRRRSGKTETVHWVDSIARVASRFRTALVRPWFVIDREGDSAEILRAVTMTEGFFTIRAAQDRRLQRPTGQRDSLHRRMRRQRTSMIDSKPANDDRFKTGQRRVTGRSSFTP
jgi:hypothetical protein